MNPHSRFRPADFKSAASADFAIRALSSSYPNRYFVSQLESALWPVICARLRSAASDMPKTAASLQSAEQHRSVFVVWLGPILFDTSHNRTFGSVARSECRYSSRSLEIRFDLV